MSLSDFAQYSVYNITILFCCRCTGYEKIFKSQMQCISQIADSSNSTGDRQSFVYQSGTLSVRQAGCLSSIAESISLHFAFRNLPAPGGKSNSGIRGHCRGKCFLFSFFLFFLHLLLLPSKNVINLRVIVLSS